MRSKILSISNFVIYKNDNSKQIVVTLDFDYNNLSDEVKKQIDEQKSTMYFINIVTDEKLDKPLKYNAVEKIKKDVEKSITKTVTENYFIYKFTNDFWSIIPIIDQLNDKL